MSQPYDPVPDIAASLAAMWVMPAHDIPSYTVTAFGRLADKLGIRPDKVQPFTTENVIRVTEEKLRQALGAARED